MAIKKTTKNSKTTTKKSTSKKTVRKLAPKKVQPKKPSVVKKIRKKLDSQVILLKKLF